MMRLGSSPFPSAQQNAAIATCLPFQHRLIKCKQHQRLLTRGVKGQSYNVEIECDEDEDPEGVFKRFRNSCNQSGMVYEARKRQYFENPQDIKKRKQQEKGMQKQRAMREKHLTTYGDAHSETPPFSDLFQGQEDIYDIIGSMSDSYDEDRSMYNRRRARNNNGGAQNSLASSSDIEQEQAAPEEPKSDPNVIVRSVASDGPPTSSGRPAEPQPKSKQKRKFETAKTRREREKTGAGRV